MEHQPDAETEMLAKPDNFESEYAALKRSRDYGDIRIFPNINELQRLGGYWKNEQNSPNRSARGKKEIDKIIGRLTFEVHSREYPARKEAITNLESVFQLEAFSAPLHEASLNHEQQAA